MRLEPGKLPTVSDSKSAALVQTVRSTEVELFLRQLTAAGFYRRVLFCGFTEIYVQVIIF